MDECDFVIPLHRFHKLVRTTIESIGSFYNPRTIYIITPEKYVVEMVQVIKNWNFKRVVVIGEETFFIKNYNLSKLNIEFELFNNNIDTRSREFGWWYQQIIKLGAFKQIADLSDQYVVWDSDLIPLVKWDLYFDGIYKFALLQHSARSEWNLVQYKDSLDDLTGLKMIVPDEGGTFVPHHFIFYHRVLEYTLNSIEKRNDEPTWIHSIIGLSHRYYRFSEYIMIATFTKMYFPDLLCYHTFDKYGYSGKRIREPKMLLQNISDQCNINEDGLSYESFCKFVNLNYDSIPSYLQIEHI